MIRRDTPRRLREASHLRVELAEGDPDMIVHLRRPLPERATELLGWYHLTMADLRADYEEGSGLQAQVDSQHTMSAIYGRLIAALWAHETLDLEAPGQAHPHPLALGTAVVEELTEALWAPAEIDALGLHARVLITESPLQRMQALIQEADRTANFGGPAGAGKV